MLGNFHIEPTEEELRLARERHRKEREAQAAVEAERARMFAEVEARREAVSHAEQAERAAPVIAVVKRLRSYLGDNFITSGLDILRASFVEFRRELNAQVTAAEAERARIASEAEAAEVRAAMNLEHLARAAARSDSAVELL